MQGSMNPKRFIFFPKKLVPCSVTTSNQTILSVVFNTWLNVGIKSFTQFRACSTPFKECRVDFLEKGIQLLQVTKRPFL